MKKKLKTLCFTIVLITFFSTLGFSNALTIASTGVVGASPGTNFTINLTIAWENSWNLAAGGTPTTPFNWDAVWIFIKYKDCDPTNFTWLHAQVDAAGHVAAAPLQIDVPTDQKGVFVRRSAYSVQGTVAATAISINITVPNGSYDFKVFGIEMVYVPQASFVLGDVANCTNSFNNITVDAAAQSGGILQATIGQAVANVPAAYPMGYNAMYCMKYELTPDQYCDMVNCLVYSQQVARFVSAPGPVGGSVGGYNSWFGYYTVTIATPGLPTTIPAIATTNASYTYTAIEALSWADLAAYLDWACLRPFTDIEFEKLCRGTDARVLGEYAGAGTSVLYNAATGPTNANTATEISSTAAGVPNLINFNNPAFRRPLRVGFGATNTSTRLASSTSFWGIADLSGNVQERIVNVNATGLLFTGILGDGLLNASGQADAANWPGTTALGAGFRGGCFGSAISECRVSDRALANSQNQNRSSCYGGRGVRQYP